MEASIKHIFKKKNDYKVAGNLFIECEGDRFFGPGRAELLELIDETGSLNKAASKMGMSYKKAWEMINELNAQSGKPIVILRSGGERGGGSIITEEAKELVAYYKLLRKRFQTFLDKETKRLHSK